MLRVLVVEDSPTERELLVAVLSADPEIEVVGQAADGVEAVQLAVDLRPSLIAMDIYMPRMDGFEATSEIMVKAPTPILLVSSSASEREVELSLRAMQAGALAVIEKPGTPGTEAFESKRVRLVALAKALAEVRVVRRWSLPRASLAPPAPSAPVPLAAVPRGRRAQLVTIAASTGGPAALRQLLGELPADLPVPVLVVQHIASGFVQGLVDWLRPHCAVRVAIAEDGETLRPGTVLFAPDDRHLGIGDDRRSRVLAAPPIDGFRPSATYLFRTAAAAYGTAVAAVILTGMGSDGVEGLRAVKAAGGTVIAQDEFTSVVYGMPREATKAGLVDAELPIHQIARRVTTLAARRRHGHDDSRR
jgi:two-component system chemotaxis response regulator CheB